MAGPSEGDPVSAWMHRLDSIGPGSLLYVIESRLGPAASGQAAAEDVFQDVMLTLCQNAERLEWRGLAAFRAWLLTVIDHRIADMARRARTGHTSAGPVMSERVAAGRFESSPVWKAVAQSTTPSRVAAYREEARAIRDALAGLPADLRDIVLARVIEQRTLEEIAESTGLTVGVVRHRLRTGTEEYALRLRRSLAASNGTAGP